MIPSSFESRSSLHGGLKPSNIKLPIGHLSSILVSETIKTSTLPQ